MQDEPEPPVVRWLDAQPGESIWITSITLFEAKLGLALLPKGKRRLKLEAAFDQLLDADLEGRVLDFDRHAAQEAGELAAARQKIGRPLDMRDTQIAGIALARRAMLATRNIRHFQDLNLKLINPWTAKND